MVDAFVGIGSLFKREDSAAPGTYVSIAEARDIGDLHLTKEARDKTHTESTEKYREYLSGYKDGDSVTITCNYLPGDSTQETLRTDFDATTDTSYQIKFSNATESEWLFDGIVTDLTFASNIQSDDPAVFTFTIKITGKPAFIASP